MLVVREGGSMGTDDVVVLHGCSNGKGSRLSLLYSI